MPGARLEIRPGSQKLKTCRKAPWKLHAFWFMFHPKMKRKCKKCRRGRNREACEGEGGRCVTTHTLFIVVMALVHIV